MAPDTFNDILDFAVAREEDAVKFYQVLQGMAKFEAQKQVLHEFELMEQGHIQILNNVRKRGEVEPEEIPGVADLKIAEYLAEGEMTDDLSYQDIIILAMKREEKAHNLYTHLAERAAAEEIKNLFLKLASEEAKHKLHFEKTYDDEVLKEN